MSDSQKLQNGETFAIASVQINETQESESKASATILDPAKHSDARAFEERISDEFDSWSKWKYTEPYRKHLGASMIGEDCLQKLWLTFRWVKAEARDGRMLRLLNRGKREEPVLVELLQGIGFEVWAHDENGKQFRMHSVAGHYGGSLDAIAIAPERYNMGRTPILVSFKTSGTGSAFTKYADDPMQIANPVYWAQENAYGYGYNINYALWLVINKNDDSIQPRIQKLDNEFGAQLERKAEKVIFSREPMSRISKSPAFKACAMCGFKDICHKGAEIDLNCRSCKHAVAHIQPREDGSGNWFCEKHCDIIPENVIALGCEAWEPVYKGE